VGTQDLRIGELRAGPEILLRVQPDADAVGGAPAAPGALDRRGLRDGFDRQPLHLEPAAVPGDPSGAGIDHVPDPGHRQGCLSDIRGQHDPACRAPVPGVSRPRAGRLEDAVLLGRRQPRVQRQDLRVGELQRLQRVAGVADLLLTGQEYQDVAGARTA
jgi:hypothetical protein